MGKLRWEKGEDMTERLSNSSETIKSIFANIFVKTQVY